MTQKRHLHPIAEFFSKNENYKSVIFSNKDKFSVQFYRWNESSPQAKVPVWEQIELPILTENQKTAEYLAKKNLSVYAGETEDESVSENFKETVQSYLGHEDFVFLETKNFTTYFLENEDDTDFKRIEIIKILEVDDFYFVETTEKNWYAGFLYQMGGIRCWKKFEALQTALTEIIKK